MSLSSSAPGPAESILATLNSAQCRAVTSPAATVAILAGPGSGKTHTLTSRVVWLVDNVGYQPADVIVATFTVKAAREMKERIGKALGQGRERKIVLGTFHSIARRYLATYGKHIGLDPKFGIADDGDSRAMIQRICKRMGLAVDPAAARAWISRKKAKGSHDSPKRLPNGRGKPVPENPELETCYSEYQKQLKRSNLLDYDDLLTMCVQLLRDYPSCVSNVQAVLIDEYQDTNGIQYELMKLFAQARQRITIVGDPDQSIYGWRSAEIRNLFRLLKEYPQADEISLEENYRSSQAILDVSLKVIQQDKKRYQKALLPVHSKGTRPVLRRLKTAAIEAEWIVAEIRRVTLMSGHMMDYEDVAILLRSASLSRHIESALGKAGIPYRMVGGFKFYERAEIKVVTDYLRVIHRPENNDALARIINVPRRGIGEATVGALLREAEEAGMSLWALLDKHCRGDRKAKTNIKSAMEQKLSGGLLKLIKSVRKKVEEPPSGSPCYHLVDLIENLLSQLNLKKYVEETWPEQHESRWANVQEFVHLAGDFMRSLSASEQDDRLPEIQGLQQEEETDALGRFLANVALASDAQTDDEADKNKASVTISTIHAAKGLEWPVVFIPAVYNGSIPHMRSDNLDEERRLLYVAMTRAKSLLYLSCPLYQQKSAGGGGGNNEKTELSQFLPSEVHPYFAKTGPSFSMEAIRHMAQILGRENAIPSAEKIFSGMPLMERLEDNLHPADPEESTGDAPSGKNGWRNRRLPGVQDSADDDARGAEGSGPSWHATTMASSSTFTMSSLPGFTTASKHRSIIEGEAKGRSSSINGNGTAHSRPPVERRGGTTKRPADQSSLWGFVAKRHKSDPSSMALDSQRPGDGPGAGLRRQIPVTHDPRNVRDIHAQQKTETQPGTIAPELARHKLGPATTAMRRPRRPAHDPVIDGPKQRYPNFSSSPPKPGSPEKENGSMDKAEAQQARNKERPASCFHVTTTTTTVAQGYGGFVRPAAIRREGGVPPLDRLRRPFKKLTMNRGNAA